MNQDDDLHRRVSALVEEEHLLRHTGAPPERAQRLSELERQLDRAWDLLRQRQAAREFGRDAAEVNEQPQSQVEDYLQ